MQQFEHLIVRDLNSTNIVLSQPNIYSFGTWLKFQKKKKKLWHVALLGSSKLQMAVNASKLTPISTEILYGFHVVLTKDLKILIVNK